MRRVSKPRIYLAHPVTNAVSTYDGLKAAVRHAAPGVRCIEPEGRLLPEVIADEAFSAIRECDLLVADISEYSIGVGVEVGYAYGLGKCIVLVARTTSRSRVSPFLRGMVQDIIFYEHDEDLPIQLADAIRRSGITGNAVPGMAAKA